ncbi:MAG: urea carboxylase-associated family protein, partial [Candidatus Eremiobacteraeota bacterium]|nr:urea carboxylase-associated family protein [Candidatus Eremiobacteraeota bacterium]
ESVTLRKGDVLFSNRSGELARVVEDTVGVHDVMLAPCSEAMFARRSEFGHPSCHGNLVGALAPFGVIDDMLTATVNVFMDVRITPGRGVTICEPASAPGARFAVKALQDLVLGIAACSSERTNAGRCKPIFYEILS